MKYQEFQEKYGIYFRSAIMRELVDVIEQIASTDITCLIYGESGVGKELVAKAIHGLSNRSSKKMFTVNCGAIPEGIIESELFGHQKGAFTGAIESRKGYFELANQSTLFLDEIGELPHSTQVKFLRILETKEVLKVGAETLNKIDVRFITATNKNLSEEVSKKKFRADLFFRLRSVMIEIPPLRNRKEDIPILTNKFVIDFCQRNSIPLMELEPEVLEVLILHSWPGNVRELRNTVESACALNKSGRITTFDIEKVLIKPNQQESQRNLPVSLNMSQDEADRTLIMRALFEIKKDLFDIKSFLNKQFQSEENQKEVLVLNNLSKSYIEKETLERALKATNYNKKEAAKLLNISLKTLYRKIQKFTNET